MPRGSVRKNLKIPTYMHAPENKLQAAYISGLYDAEGSVRKRQAEIDFFTTSEELFEFITSFLNRNEIKFSTLKRTRHLTPEYEIYIYGVKNLKRFSELIKFRHPLKFEKIESFLIRNC